MFVGVALITLHIPHARSLKDKRSVVRKFRDRVAARFAVSIAEVEAQDLYQRAVFGVSIVSSDKVLCDAVLTKVMHLAGQLPDALLVGQRTELFPIHLAEQEEVY